MASPPPSSIIIADRTIPLSVRVSARAKRISIRLSPAKNGIIMTLPKRASLKAGMRFLLGQSEWVLAHIQETPPTCLGEGSVIPILGKHYVIRREEGRGTARLTEDRLELFCRPEFTVRRVKDFLKKLLHAACMERASRLSEHIGKPFSKIIIKETNARWGSCNAQGVLAFNWLLVFAPTAVLDYLVAHEVAHLQEMNHSPRFWHLVKTLCPHMEQSRRWLQKEGHSLHHYSPVTA